MKMYEIVQNQEKMEEILVLMNKWYLNRNTKDKMLLALERIVMYNFRTDLALERRDIYKK